MSKQTLSKQTIQWILKWLCGGLALGAAALAFCYPYTFSLDAKTARKNGYPLYPYVTIQRITNDTQYRPLSAQEVETLESFVQNTNIDIRTDALCALAGACGPDQAQRVAQIARTKLTDASPLVRQYALSALDQVKAPDALSMARRMQEDPSDYVKTKAQQIINASASTIVAKKR